MCDKSCGNCNDGPVHVPVEKEMKNTNEFGAVHLFIRKECSVCGKMLGDTVIRRAK